MSASLRALARALDALPTPRRVFFRDDDVGWAERHLGALLAVFERHRLPVDLAVIPAALDRGQALRLAACVQAAAAPIGLHQHGLAHVSHETTARRSEFGPARDAVAQRRDIVAGREHLRASLGDRVDPIFTPPWNRCTRDTAMALRALGFRALSRDASAGRLDVPGLAEIAVRVDWVRERREDAGGGRLLERIAHEVARPDPLGIMLHHAEMDAADLAMLDALLARLRESPRISCVPMRRLLPAEACAAAAEPAP